MAEVQLKNIKKVYPFVSGEDKKKKKKSDEPEKKVNLQITDEGVVAVQQFSLDIKDKEFIVLVSWSVRPAAASPRPSAWSRVWKRSPTAS